MVNKRALSQSTAASSQPTSSSRSHPSPRPPKRSRIASPSSSSLPEPSTLLSVVPQTPSQPSTSTAPLPPAPSPTLPPLPPPSKRPFHPGKLRRLAHAKPLVPLSGSKLPVRPKTTLAGAKVGGKSKDLRDGVVREEMWVRRSNGGTATRNGMGFAGYLKKGVGAFVDRGCTSLSINAMGAAIPLALTLALAVRDAIPGGEPARLPGGSDEEAEAGQEEVVKMEVRTGSKVVRDEITPEDDDEDMIYQTRTKSTVEIELSIASSLASSLGQPGGGEKGRRGGGQGGRGGASARGRKRRGGKK
ncbi:hypothetical protein JCM11251_002395 [Rhodosporidiobolus azoricus]